MNSFSLKRYETSPLMVTYPPATARALDVSLISSETMLDRSEG